MALQAQFITIFVAGSKNEYYQCGNGHNFFHNIDFSKEGKNCAITQLNALFSLITSPALIMSKQVPAFLKVGPKYPQCQ
mgnify:CR=1 FL=1